MRQTTLCTIRRGDEILLAMKKRGFGIGKWNGPSGKVHDGEDVRAAAVRELQEEIGIVVQPGDLVHAGTIDFSFDKKPNWAQRVFIFLVDVWDGEPHESEEMRPRWFTRATIPYDAMWKDDVYWLPTVLEGKPISGKFHFSEDGSEILSYEINRQTTLAI